MKRIALIHYWLTGMRGGERVIEEFCRLWPDADIFTHAFNPAVVSPTIKAHRVSCSFINCLPGASNHAQKYLPLMPTALRKLDLSGYDLIVSSESGPAKGIRKPSAATHICYCHTPMRYLWDMYEEYYRQAGLGGKIAMSLFKHYLRGYDLKSAESVDRFIANSAFVAERIKRIYHRDATVIYPPVDIEFFGRPSVPDRNRGDYYLYVGQLIHYKQPELAVAACNRMNRRLIIAGTGPLQEKLAGMNRNGNISLAGKVSDEELRNLYAGAKALLFPGVEDFGIVPLEAQAAGTPVIAMGAGGALETVLDRQTGVFFPRPEVDDLCHAIEEFEHLAFCPEVLRSHAAKFSPGRFRAEIEAFIKASLPSGS